QSVFLACCSLPSRDRSGIRGRSKRPPPSPPLANHSLFHQAVIFDLVARTSIPPPSSSPPPPSSSGLSRGPPSERGAGEIGTLHKHRANCHEVPGTGPGMLPPLRHPRACPDVPHQDGARR